MLIANHSGIGRYFFLNLIAICPFVGLMRFLLAFLQENDLHQPGQGIQDESSIRPCRLPQKEHHSKPLPSQGGYRLLEDERDADAPDSEPAET